MTPSLTIQPWFQFNPVLEDSEMDDFDVTESGLFIRLRIYAWKHFGLPADLDALRKIAMLNCGISSYRFKKCWESIKQKFSQNDAGRLVYQKDEERRIQSPESSRKFQELGKKGAQARWKKQSPQSLQSALPIDSGRHDPAIVSEWQTADSTSENLHTAAVENTTTVEQLPALAAAVETQCPNTFRLIASIFRDVTPAFIERLLSETRKVLPTAGDEDLAIAVRATYRAGKQSSAGLFLTSVPAWLSNRPPEPKPVEAEANYILPHMREKFKVCCEERGIDWRPYLEGVAS